MIQTQNHINQLTQKDVWNLAVEHDIISTYFDNWHVYGQAQYDLLKHFIDPAGKSILDIGCGGVRLGSYVLGDAEFYMGVDPFDQYLGFGQSLIDRLGYSERAQLVHSVNFGIPEDRKFDFAWSQSVFTHLSERQIQQCLDKLLKVMKPGAPLVFTYITTKQSSTHHEGRLYQQRMPVICSFLAGTTIFEKFAEKHGLKFIADVDRQHIPKELTQKVGILTF